ncbi:hypothetical protein X801_08160 [Opisthorchis viverrini]|uniref:PHD-type domain-containing protein n=1 Tax=Opisthorchis viverrini TaxID=6198 RepID=A0A1S8WNG1_OPIVI|nr:hypothetical protein X801_08160 [Opisthorchis viverrini]
MYGFRCFCFSVFTRFQEIKPSSLLEPVLAESAVSAEVKTEAEHSSLEVQSRNGPRFGRVSIGRKAVHATDSTTPGVHRGIKRRGTTLSPTSNKHGMFVDKERVLSRASGAVTDSVILECFVCHGLQDQHLITKCDTCSKAFHLACLDPPLLRCPNGADSMVEGKVRAFDRLCRFFAGGDKAVLTVRSQSTA